MSKFKMFLGRISGRTVNIGIIKSHKIHKELGDVSYVTTGFSSENVTLGKPTCIDSPHFSFLFAFGRWPVPISTRLQATVTVLF
jgi:hypothetical protein